MLLLWSTLSLLIVADPAAAAPPTVTAEQVRAAVDKSLPFLLAGGELWREGKTEGGQNGRVCVTCHQIPFTIWSHNEALARSFKIEQARLDDLTAWSLDWCATQKHPKTQSHTGGFLTTMQQMIMGRPAGAPNQQALETFELFERVIGTMQKPEGYWKEGNQISRPGAEPEANEVDTMWIIQGLSSLEQIHTLPKATRDAAAAHRQKALAFLKESKPGVRSDWLALRMLVEAEYGDKAQAQELLQQLLAQQNADGGWPLAKGEASHPLVTGQSLYALARMGRTAKDPVVHRAQQYLVAGQQPDGAWKATSRRDPHINTVTIHWGTAWATIGLIRSLEK